MRQNTLARARRVDSIEGYNATLADAVKIVDDERPETLEDETLRALYGYRSAMNNSGVSDDPHTRVNPEPMRSLHYMMLNYDFTKLPGQWRAGHVFVVD